MISKIKTVASKTGMITVVYDTDYKEYKATIMKKTGWSMVNSPMDMKFSAAINKKSDNIDLDINKDLFYLRDTDILIPHDTRPIESGIIIFSYKEERCSADISLIPENFLRTFARLTKETAAPLIKEIAKTSKDRKNKLSALKILSQIAPEMIEEIAKEKQNNSLLKKVLDSFRAR